MKNYLPLLLSLFLVSTLNAQIYVKHDATGNNDGTSWENAFANLQAGIDAANEGDQIWVAMGTYKPSGPTPDSSHFMVTTAVELYGGFDGTESQLEERDWENNPTIISGDLNGDDKLGDFINNRHDNAFHVFFIDTETSRAIVDGFVVTSGMTRTGNFNLDEAIKYRGGGMYVRSTGDIVIRRCLFINNLGYQGGSLFARSDTANGNSIYIEDCVFESNYGIGRGTLSLSEMDSAFVINSVFRKNESENFGGALRIGNTNGEIFKCNFTSNNCPGGGAVAPYNNSDRILDSSTIRFRECTFDDNFAATRGGAMMINNSIARSTYIIDSCRFTNNNAMNSNSHGGAISAASFDKEHSSSFRLEIDKSEFINNSSQRGGGIGVLSLADTIEVYVSNSTFLHNGTDFAGAGHFESKDGMKVHLTNLHVEENRMPSSGGGFYFNNENIANPFPVYLENCIFLNNSSENFYGGAIFARDIEPLSIIRCEFTGNESEIGGSAICHTNTECIIQNSLFQENYITGSDTLGGGALYGFSGKNTVMNTYFINNQSMVEGAAIGNMQGGNMHLEGVVMQDNTGESTIINRSSKLNLTNVSMVDNEFGIKQDDMSHLTLQNTILANEGANLLSGGQDSIVSRGANISDDVSLANYLTGQAGYPDLNETDPLLDNMLVPLPESPAVDKGNPENVELTFDAKGEPRIMGTQIDIGALESPFTSSARDIDWDSGRLTVFPNPVAEHIHFELTKIEAGAVHINIFNSTGHSVFSDVVRHSAGALTYKQEVTHLPAGSYYLVVSATEGHFGAGITVLK